MRYQLGLKLLGVSALGIVCSTPVWAQSKDADEASSSNNDIIVTAQRMEQRLQDVPISITVLSEQALANNNITNAKDIATYTPGLVTNNRYGSDNTTWTIRGFTQEQRTTATVGTYFADVVAPRGSGATQGGDGAGPGQLFDLQNIQVLKGPQGTLFGRNSTGGAVLLVPNKPTDRLEGYVEGSAGDYDMWRLQGVLNVPLTDTFKVRLGVDRLKRDGFLKNAGHLGFGPYGDAGGSIDNFAARLSVVADLTPDLENYTIASYAKTKSSGVIPKINRCFAAVPTNGPAACAQQARQDALGFWTVSNPIPDSQSVTEQWQVINTTTWRVSDSLTVKNIASYGEFRGRTNIDLFGQYQLLPGVTYGAETALQVKPFAFTHSLPGGWTNAESSFVEELQFQGHGAGSRLTWQGGLYLEVNDPIGKSGVQTATLTPCADITTLNCLTLAGGGAISAGRVAFQTTKNYFRGRAAYFQASYDLTDQLKLTGGIRYTWDEMRSVFQAVDVSLRDATVNTGGTLGSFAACTNLTAFGAVGSAGNPRLPVDQRYGMCFQDIKVKTSAPTWLLDLDYRPIEDILLYAKWSRGYRQGGVASFAADKLQAYDKETVDTYEVGAKASWHGSTPGYFNVAGFYNDFRNQQLQIGLRCINVAACPQTTAILNAGKSRLYGLEAEAGVTLFDSLRLQASYAYLNTKVVDIANVIPIIQAVGLPFDDPRPLLKGGVIPQSVPHKLVASAEYTLPLPETVGKLSVGGTFVYTSKYRVVSETLNNTNPNLATAYANTYGILPGSHVLNLNVNWKDVAGMPIDAAFFMTNVTNEKTFLHVNVQDTQGFLSYIIGEPRMWGFRLRYKFGS